MGMTGEEKADETAISDSVILTKLDKVIAWGRKYSFFTYPFITACCGMEFMSVAGPRYDIDRFGAALPRFSPRQADLMMVVGTISHKQAPILVKVYNQMTEPKWVFAFGACVVSGGMYNNYATVQGIDTLIPVDIYVPGCPPRPEMVLDGLIMLQEKVDRTRGQMTLQKGISPLGEADDRKIIESKNG